MMPGRPWAIQVGVGRVCCHISRRHGITLHLLEGHHTDCFLQSEHYTPATPEITAQYQLSADMEPHGHNGPVGSSYPPYSFGITNYFYRAWESIGVKRNPQPSNGRATGVFDSSLAIKHDDMTRSSATAAYYKPITDQRPNLHLLTGQRVSKVFFDGKRACGVEVILYWQDLEALLTDA